MRCFIRLYIILILEMFLMFPFQVTAQSDLPINENALYNRLIINEKLLETEPDRAFEIYKDLLKEALKLEDHNAELTILLNNCEYYQKKLDFENMYFSAQKLLTKSKNYKSIYFQTISREYIAQFYYNVGLYDKALTELHIARKNLGNEDVRHQAGIREKANIDVEIANVFLLKGDKENAIRSMKSALEGHLNLKNPLMKRMSTQADYSNLGALYLDIDVKHAMYFAQQSINLYSENDVESDVMFTNFIVLGRIFTKKHMYKQAESYLKKAENFKDFRRYSNVEELYTGFINLYKISGQEEKVAQYSEKLKDLKLTSSENKNKSLISIIKKNNEEASGRKSYWVFFMVIIFLILIVLLIIFISKKKNHISMENEKSVDKKDIIALLEMVKTQDSAYLASFHNTFPSFLERLRSIDDGMIQSEIEFCTLLKLNLSTKEIARYRDIQPKTVQNRKNRIRKKLGVPTDTDIYVFINNL